MEFIDKGTFEVGETVAIDYARPGKILQYAFQWSTKLSASCADPKCRS
jgi:hypothetical protein